MNNYRKKNNLLLKKHTDKKYIDKYIKDEYLTDDGDADIFLNMIDKDELFDSRTVGKQKDLNDNIYDYIENKSSILDCNTKIHLHIIGIELTKEEEQTVKDLIKEHYSVELYKNQKEYSKYKKNLLMLISVGLISFLIYVLLYFFTNLAFALEMFCFLFSFALWEAFDYYIYVFSEIKIERDNIIQDLNLEVDFNK